MKTLRNIHEGFFSNVGATGALYKSKLIEYFENINKNIIKIGDKLPHIQQYTIKTSIDALKSAPDDWFADGLSSLLTKRNPSDEVKIRAVKNFFSTSLIITSDVFDPNITTLPNWFKINSILELYRNLYDYSEYLFVYIDGMTNLDPKEVVDFLKNFKTVNGIHIVNCPKFKRLDGFPPVIGKYGCTFIPSPNVKFRYSEVLKHFDNISGPIIFDRVSDNYNDKLLKKIKAKSASNTKIETKKTDTIASGEEIVKQPKERTKITAWKGASEDAPIWKVDERNRVHMPDGVEFGRLTRDCTTVYRQVNKALFVKEPSCNSFRPGDLIGYAYDKKGNLVCKLIRGNV